MFEKIIYNRENVEFDEQVRFAENGIDKAAGRLYDTMYKKLSESREYRKTGDFMKDLRIETEKKRLIEEEILNELVYVD